jgi:hypothetical protein
MVMPKVDSLRRAKTKHELKNYKPQITNPKQISNYNNVRLPVGRQELPKPVCLEFCDCLLVFACYLDFVIWCLPAM